MPGQRRERSGGRDNYDKSDFKGGFRMRRQRKKYVFFAQKKLLKWTIKMLQG